MEKHEEQLAAIQEMRNLMDRASRFRSISGLSAAVAGLLALLCVAVVSLFTDILFVDAEAFDQMARGAFATPVFTCFLLLLVVSVGFGITLAARNARSKGQSAWDSAAKRLAYHVSIPLVVGGIFSFLMGHLGLWGLVPAITLLFYGLALFNGSHYTLDAIRILGLCEMMLGLLAAFWVAYGLVIWVVGFGLLHVVFGLYLYLKYERV